MPAEIGEILSIQKYAESPEKCEKISNRKTDEFRGKYGIIGAICSKIF